MTTFHDRAEFEGVMSKLFERLMAVPSIARPLGATEMIVRFRYPDLGSVITFDFKHAPPSFSTEDSGAADVEMVQSSDTAHEFWLGRLNAVRAIATGKVRARGDVAKALKLLPAIRPAFSIYPQVLESSGLRAAAQPAHAERAREPWGRRLRALWPRRRDLDRSRLPVDTRPPSMPEPAPLATNPAPLPEDATALRVAMFERMLRIRELEEQLAASWERGLLPTAAIHLSTGQEAVAVGVCFALRKDDVIATTHRGHGHMLAKGAPADAMIAEIFGKDSGLCRGKGGSMHVTDASVGGLGANGIVGASPLLATGAALAFAQRGEDRVAVAFLGDGATNQGMFHEALNLAAAWKLPVLFVVENNGYGEFTAQRRSTAIERLADRAGAYGMPGVTIDGNDVDLVHRTTEDLVAKLRAGSGPALLECVTYRWRGHMEGDAQSYRSDEERASWRERDPIGRVRAALVAGGALDAARADALAASAKAEMQRAVEVALAAAEPARGALMEHVFAPAHATREARPSSATRNMTGSEAINLALREELARDPSVILLGEDVSLGGYLAVTRGLVEEFGPSRIRDTPISENAIVGGALGAAMNGLRPVAEILFSDFLTACADPIVNQAAKLRYMSGGQYTAPMVVRTPSGAGLGMAAQHSQSLEAMFMGIPGLVVAAPGTPRDCRALLKAAIRSDNPVLFFEHKLLYLSEGEVPLEEEVAPFGVARVVREGRDVTVVALSYMVQVALEAAAQLAAEGIEVEVIDPRTIAPLDTDTILASVVKTRRLVTVEEAPVRGGFGAEVVARVATAAHHVLAAAPVRVGAVDAPIPYNKALECLAVPDAARIAAAVRALVRGS